MILFNHLLGIIIFIYVNKKKIESSPDAPISKSHELSVFAIYKVFVLIVYYNFEVQADYVWFYYGNQ